MTSRTRIAVAIERRLEMDLLVPTLKREGNRFKVIFCVSDFSSLMRMLKVEEPDILIADISIHDHRGDPVILQVKKRYPLLRIVLRSNFNFSLFQDSLFKIGYDVILTKEINLALLWQAIEQVESSFAPELSEITDRLQFTKKELEIIPKICAGSTLKEIANELHVSEKAIEKHRQKIYRKTNCRNKADFVVHAIKNDLVYVCTLFVVYSFYLKESISRPKKSSG